ncbi:MAG TPA: hypothetical protein VF590_01445 [Isosphaeraceae bacterium]|jgi:ABC-type Zn2+ transport system substrate-binding protein/surface adhesin
MNHDHGDDHDHDHEHEHEHEESLELELGTQSKIFLEMRQQNLDLLELAAMVAGYAADHGPLKAGDMKHAMRTIWEIYSEFYTWIDPEEDTSEGDEDGEEEE